MSGIIGRFKSIINKDYDPEKEPNYVETTNENTTPSMLNISRAYIKKQALGAMKKTSDIESLKSYIDAILEYYNTQYTNNNEREINQKLLTELQPFKDIAPSILMQLNTYVGEHALNNTNAYEFAHKLFDTFLEQKEISRDMKENVIEPNNNTRGGSYKKSKKRHRPSLKKSRRIKTRKTKPMRKTRKSKK